MADLRRGRRDWYRIEAKADEATIYIYDEIGFVGVTASNFVRDLSGVQASRIILRINSPGGDVFDGVAIHTALTDHPAEVEARIDGLAASAASFIAQAGDRVVMARHSTMMIHDPWGFTIGDAADHRKQTDVLDQIGDMIAGIYAARAGGTLREWRDRMLAETWYTDRAAVEAGLADEVAGDPPAEAQDPENAFDLSMFRNTPAHLLRPAASRQRAAPTKRDVERALRDAGLSQAAAKALVAGGWPSAAGHEPRDVAELEQLLATLRRLNAA